jgi:hypothetical protein
MRKLKFEIMGNKMNQASNVHPQNLRPKLMSNKKNFNMNELLNKNNDDENNKIDGKSNEMKETIDIIDSTNKEPSPTKLRSEIKTKTDLFSPKLSLSIKERIDRPYKSSSMNQLIDFKYKTNKTIQTNETLAKPTKSTKSNVTSTVKLVKLNNPSVSAKTELLHELDNYAFLKVIGKGTYGKVVLSRHRKTGELFALKCLKKEEIRGRNITNLKNEKAILEKISHPFIAKLHCTFQTVDKVYFVFQYYNGGELFHHLSKGKKLGEHQIKHIAAQIYLTLTYLHSKSIIYRDMKPENIILDKFGNIKLVDFGMAKDDVTANKFTSTFCGTNEYIPPEIVKGEDYGCSCDWWSFGILLFEMLNGFPPFAEQNKNTLFKKIIHDDPVFGDSKLSSECKDLIFLLLKKNVSMRIKPEEIPNHPWFKQINFKDMLDLKLKSEFIPKVKNASDFSNISTEFLKQAVDSPVIKKNKPTSTTKIENQYLFDGF